MSKNIILDLDNTLICSFAYSESLANQIKNIYSDNEIFSFEIDGIKYITVKRTGVDVFLDYCEVNFNKVIIWSTGVELYVKRIVKKLFKNRRVDCVLSRKQAETYVTQEKKTDYHKPITKIQELYPDFNVMEKNIIIVDDNHRNFRTYAECGILIPAFGEYGETGCPLPDIHLLSLLLYFCDKNFVECDDIRFLNKSKIFTNELL